MRLTLTVLILSALCTSALSAQDNVQENSSLMAAGLAGTLRLDNVTGYDEKNTMIGAGLGFNFYDYKKHNAGYQLALTAEIAADDSKNKNIGFDISAYAGLVYRLNLSVLEIPLCIGGHLEGFIIGKDTTESTADTTSNNKYAPDSAVYLGPYACTGIQLNFPGGKYAFEALCFVSYDAGFNENMLYGWNFTPFIGITFRK